MQYESKSGFLCLADLFFVARPPKETNLFLTSLFLCLSMNRQNFAQSRIYKKLSFTKKLVTVIVIDYNKKDIRNENMNMPDNEGFLLI